MNKTKYYLLNTFLLVASFVPLVLLFVSEFGASGDSKFIYLEIYFLVGIILLSLKDSINIEGSKLYFFIGKPLKFHSIDISQIGRIDISNPDLGNKDVNLTNLLLLLGGRGLPTIKIFTKENNIILSYSRLKKENLEKFQLIIPSLLVINPSIVINETIASSVNKTSIRYSEDFYKVLIISILVFFLVIILLATFVNLIPF